MESLSEKILLFNTSAVGVAATMNGLSLGDDPFIAFGKGAAVASTYYLGNKLAENVLKEKNDFNKLLTYSSSITLVGSFALMDPDLALISAPIIPIGAALLKNELDK